MSGNLPKTCGKVSRNHSHNLVPTLVSNTKYGRKWIRIPKPCWLRWHKSPVKLKAWAGKAGVGAEVCISTSRKLTGYLGVKPGGYFPARHLVKLSFPEILREKTDRPEQFRHWTPLTHHFPYWPTRLPATVLTFAVLWSSATALKVDGINLILRSVKEYVPGFMVQTSRAIPSVAQAPQVQHFYHAWAPNCNLQHKRTRAGQFSNVKT